MYFSISFCVTNSSAIWKIIFEKFSSKRKCSGVTGNELQKNPLLWRETIYEEINCFENICLSRTIWSREYIFISPGKRTIHMVFEWIESKWGKHEGSLLCSNPETIYSNLMVNNLLWRARKKCFSRNIAMFFVESWNKFMLNISMYFLEFSISNIWKHINVSNNRIEIFLIVLNFTRSQVKFCKMCNMYNLLLC